MDLRAGVGRLLGTPVARAEQRGGADTGTTWHVTLADGRELFVKHRPDAPAGFFAAEVAGLGWLARAGAVPLPAVLAADAQTVVLPWLAARRPDGTGAERLGRELAALHRAGAPAFGADWPGWIGALPLDNRPLPDWPAFYAGRRIQPYVRMLRDASALSPADAATFDRLTERIGDFAGPPEPPARIHGDLWSGNVLWAEDGRAWLIDPAAHGGHRETDLAMLALFDAPWRHRIVGAYREAFPLADGWPDRAWLHQLHPLLVHAVLFGGGYLDSALDNARRHAGRGREP